MSAETEAPEKGQDVVPLDRPPVLDTVDPRRLALIKTQIAPGCSDGEVAHFLELCGLYGLDPFAREAWCVKNRSTILIMVGRDGLRKIAQRNGLHVDGDVVRENDEVTIVRTPDGNRTVAHSYGNPAARGQIVGAWAECREGGPTGRPMGYFYAPLDEYLPANASDYSPWKKQVGVMILAAAERQAIRQATPLGGLLAEGEDEVVRDHELTAGAGTGQAPGVDLPPAVEAVMERARELGHVGLADRAAAEMTLMGQPGEFVADWVARAAAELDAMPQVVDAEPVDAAGAEAREAEELFDEAESNLTDLLTVAQEAGDQAEVERVEAQLAALRAERDARADADQGQLL